MDYLKMLRIALEAPQAPYNAKKTQNPPYRLLTQIIQLPLTNYLHIMWKNSQDLLQEIWHLKSLLWLSSRKPSTGKRRLIPKKVEADCEEERKVYDEETWFDKEYYEEPSYTGETN